MKEDKEIKTLNSRIEKEETEKSTRVKERKCAIVNEAILLINRREQHLERENIK